MQKGGIVDHLADALEDVEQQRLQYLRIEFIHPLEIECLEMGERQCVFRVVEYGSVLALGNPGAQTRCEVRRQAVDEIPQPPLLFGKHIQRFDAFEEFTVIVDRRRVPGVR